MAPTIDLFDSSLQAVVLQSLQILFGIFLVAILVAAVLIFTRAIPHIQPCSFQALHQRQRVANTASLC